MTLRWDKNLHTVTILFFKSLQWLKAEMSIIKVESLLAWKVFDHTFARDYVFLDHTQSGIVYNFGQFSLSVCMYVCMSDDNFRKTSCRKKLHICKSCVSPGNTDQKVTTGTHAMDACMYPLPCMLKFPPPITQHL